MESAPELTALCSADCQRVAAGRPGGPQALRRRIRHFWHNGIDDAAETAWLPHTIVDATRVIREHDGVTKFLFGDDPGYEAVLLPMGRGVHHCCLSTQVGCRMGCRFCSTGRLGFRSSLSPEAIIAQVLVARSLIGSLPRHLVFMGMGEPLDNQEGLFQAIRILTDPGGAAYRQERITVCTVGHVDGIAALADQGWRRLNLSFSLHAADDDLRAAIMPTAKRWPLKAIQEALIAYRPRPNFQLGINYTLLPGINDRAGDAAAVAEFCRPLGRVQVNCIPYNPDDQPLTRAPEEREIVTFVEALRAEGLSVRRRITKGRDIAAACGQLAGGSAGAIS